MSDAKTYDRISFVVDPEIRQIIKVWRHQEMIDTEGEAVRLLIRDALERKGMLNGKAPPVAA